MNPTKPLRREDVKARRLGQEWMLYDGHSGSVHIINETAARIWEMCDGTRSIEEMAAAMAQDYELPAGVDVRRDLAEVIETFRQMNVLQPVAE